MQVVPPVPVFGVPHEIHPKPMTSRSLLRNVTMFAGLDDDQLMVLEQHVSARRYPKNAVVISEGDDANALYVILEGEVKVYLSNDEGKEIIINTQGPGDHFGELALIDDSPRSASVMTTQPSHLAVMSKADFRDALARFPDISLSLIRELTRRVRDLSENVRSLALLDVYGRIVKTLMGLARPEGEGWVIEERLTQQDIANRVGSSREMVARILKELVTGGYLSIDRKIITIHRKLPNAY